MKCIKLCDVEVRIFTSGSTVDFLRPLLYEWRILQADKLVTLYVGKSKGGSERPTLKYPEVVSDLRKSRGKRHLAQDPVKHYFPRNVWGFRWIHHQLEASAYRILNENPKDERIELHVSLHGIAPTNLAAAEQEAIANAKRIHARTDIVANDLPCMGAQRRSNLDEAWVQPLRE